MSEVIAKRYAEALFQLGKEKNRTEELIESCRVTAEVFQNNQQLNTLLEHPSISSMKKEQFLEDVLNGVAREVVNTIKILVNRHRTGIIPGVMQTFIQMVDDAKGVEKAHVYTARKLSNEAIGELEVAFAKRFGKKEMQLENIVDPSVIGGVKVRVGNTIYDGSLSGKLHRMKRDIVSINHV